MSKTVRLTIVLMAVIVGLGILVAVKLAQAESTPNSRSKVQSVPFSGKTEDGLPSADEPRPSPTISDTVSPGSFQAGDVWVVRVYADQPPPDGRHTLPSQFTRATLADLESRLASLVELSGRADVVYGFSYDPETDTVQVTGNLTPAELSVLSDAVGKVTFTYAKDGGRNRSSKA